MYAPTRFREERAEILAQAIETIVFANLVTPTADGLVVSHVPMVFKPADDRRPAVLESHVARPNPHWRALTGAGQSVAIFQGPQAYISPAWYPSKREHGKVVPTWTYIAVHAHGPLSTFDGEGDLSRHLKELTALKERGRAEPWQVEDAPAHFIEGLERAIVGLRMTVDRLEGAWKLNQHKSEADRVGTIAGLDASSDPRDRLVAEAMRQAEGERAN